MLTRRMFAAAVALATLIGVEAQSLGPGVAQAALDVGAAETQFLEALNADRLAHGLAPLVADSRLMEVARWRSEDMVVRNYLSHDIGGYTIARILRDRGIRFIVAGENLVSNTFDDASTVAQAQAELMRSPNHRENILRPEFNLVGVGIAAGTDRRRVYTQVFMQASASSERERDSSGAQTTPSSAPVQVLSPTPVSAATAPSIATAPPASGSAAASTAAQAAAPVPADSTPVRPPAPTPL